MNIVIYIKEYCPYCRMARELLDSKGASYETIDIEGNAQLRQQMMERSGRRTVPQIFIDQRHIGGFDDLNMLHRNGSLDVLLNQAASSAAASA